MRWTAYILPLLCACILLIAAVRKVMVYDSFAAGAGRALPLLKNLFPYVAAVLVLAELFEASGLSAQVSASLSPVFSALGIPEEIAPLVLVKPFSGSGSLSLLNDIFVRYGADSYIARCASVVYASGETVFYLSAVYYSGVAENTKSAALPAALGLLSNFVAILLGCLLCRVL